MMLRKLAPVCKLIVESCRRSPSVRGIATKVPFASDR
jgi:hypothetical protein